MEGCLSQTYVEKSQNIHHGFIKKKTNKKKKHSSQLFPYFLANHCVMYTVGVVLYQLPFLTCLSHSFMWAWEWWKHQKASIAVDFCYLFNMGHDF